MTSFISRLQSGIVAFREAFLTAPVVDTTDWSEQKARQLRYEMSWAQYEQTSYRNVHAWAVAYRKQYGLYKYTRPIYNPVYRLGEFWKTHLFGGLLDVGAGEAGAIPIQTDNERLREAIAELWKWSRWGVQKDILTTRGTILGDVALQVVDDVSRERVYLDILHPGSLASVERDPFGNVKAYTIQETRPDPRIGNASNSVTYTEQVTREGENVVYQTFLNGQPYAWPGNVRADGEGVAEWREPYGFVPLVVIQHNDVGLEWGWSEAHPVRAKIQEADDLASQISDQVRKTIDPVWLMRGMQKTTVTVTGADATTDRPEPGREELKALWNVGRDGEAKAMVAELDLANTLAHLDNILKEIERDVPELSQDIYTASGDASGRALRTARQPVTAKVIQRRANYDAGLVAAQQMAVAIGGFRGYTGYDGFGLESYEAGDLNHSIAARPVFEEDPLDKFEVEAAFWNAAGAAVKAGADLAGYLKHAGWDDEQIAEVVIDDAEPMQEEQPAGLAG